MPQVDGTDPAGVTGRNKTTGGAQGGCGIYGTGGQFAGKFDGALQVNGDANIKDTLTVNGNADIEGALTLGGSINLGSNSQVAFVCTVRQEDLFPQPQPPALGPICAVVNHPQMTTNPNALLFVTPVGSQTKGTLGDLGTVGTFVTPTAPMPLLW